MKKKNTKSNRKIVHKFFVLIISSIKNGKNTIYLSVFNFKIRLNKIFNILQSQEVEETLKRIASHKGVVGTIVVNNEGK